MASYRAVALLCLSAATAPLAAHPGPFFVGLAAAADDPKVATANQAAMTRFDSRVVRLGVAGYSSDSKWRGNFNQGANPGTEHSSGDGFIPFAALVQPINDNLVFGLTFSSPSSNSDEYDDDWIGRYFVTEYSLLNVSAVPSIAWRVSDTLSLGFAAFATYTRFEYEAAVLNLDPGYDDGRLRLEADGTSIAWGVSLLWEPNATTRFGARYQSEIDPELDDTPEFRDLGPLTEQLLSQLGALDAQVEIRSRSPRNLLVGAHHEFESGWSMSADALWLDFSRFLLSEFRFNGGDFLNLSGSYQDIYVLSVGTTTPQMGRWQFGAGAMYLTSGVKDDERTMLLRLDEAWTFGIGGQWRWRNDRTLGMTLNWTRMGDAPVATGPIGQLGSLSGRFDERRLWFATLTLDLGRTPGR